MVRTHSCTALSVLMASSVILCMCLTEPVGNDLQERYVQAIEDARTAEEGEVHAELVAIVEPNAKLRWTGEAGSRRVLMVSWTSWDGYTSHEGGPMNLTQEVWVTAVPEVSEFCTGLDLSPVDLTLRLEQLLGLPPDDGKTSFVELWVDPRDLFRPSPDPEITDRVAELNFPDDIDEEHRAWFDRLKEGSYGEDGYPWTRLGYTYDWGDPESEVGPSEFLVRKGAEVTVHVVVPTDEYCRQ